MSRRARSAERCKRYYWPGVRGRGCGLTPTCCPSRSCRWAKRTRCRSSRWSCASSGGSAFDDVTIITGYLTELVEAFCGDGRRFGTRLSYCRETRRLGTAGGLTLLDRPREPVLVINGDILTTLDYAEMYRLPPQPRMRPRRSPRIPAK